jgi:ferric-dicitrate binding protein FerR (iron transport regulator)
MITKLENIGKLVGKYLRQELTEEEQRQLNEWINESGDNKDLFEKWTDAAGLMLNISDWERLEKTKQNAWQNMNVREEKEVRHSRLVSLRWWKYAAAAAIVIVVATSAYLLLTAKNKKPKIITQTENNRFKTDKNPGKDGAILTLADGKQIVLDDAANGNLVTQGSTKVTKDGALLSYNQEGKLTGEVLYNTLSTPRGRQFQLMLPDGSRIWLNAASSVQYPTVFAGKERVIEISGEAYLEVAKNAAKPFKVHVSPPPIGGEPEGPRAVWVEVLGTHFNIKAYNDENAVSTTLLEGKVKIKNGSAVALITPGQQGVISPFIRGGRGEAIKVIPNADIGEALAWKNGMIVANRATVKEALRQISRWYDIDLVFENGIKEEDVRIRVPRNTPLSDVLKIFELSSHLRFNIEGNKLIVSQL